MMTWKGKNVLAKKDNANYRIHIRTWNEVLIFQVSETSFPIQADAFGSENPYYQNAISINKKWDEIPNHKCETLFLTSIL